MFQAIIDALKTFLNDTWAWAVGEAEALLGIDFAALDPTGGLAFMIVFFDNMNQIVPIYACITLVFTGVVAKWTVWGIRHIIGWIPTVEG